MSIFAAVHCDGKTYKTKIINYSSQQRWNEAFKWDFYSKPKSISVTLLQAQGSFYDEAIGNHIIDIRKYFEPDHKGIRHYLLIFNK